MRPKTTEMRKARLLRKDGLSLNQIARTLGVSVSSVSVWVRSLDSAENIKAGVAAKNLSDWKNRQKLGNIAYSKICQDERNRHRESGRLMAVKSDPLHVLFCGLYWGEGTKSRSSFRIVNSDPKVIEVTIKFLIKFFPDEHKKARYSVSAYADARSKSEIIDFWSSVVNDKCNGSEKMKENKHFLIMKNTKAKVKIKN